MELIVAGMVLGAGPEGGRKPELLHQLGLGYRMAVGVEHPPTVARLAHGRIGRTDQLGPYYFLSCPRRFGKNLLLDTIKEL